MVKLPPLVSIVLCTYNGEKYINEQLESLLAQTYPNIEIVIVDDCSSDLTFEILKYYQKNSSIIKLYKNEQNLGFNGNFRRSIALSTGEYIAIADQDDIWLKEKICTLIENIDNNLLIYHDSEYIDAKGTLISKSTRSHHRFVQGKCSKNLVFYNCVSGHACMIRKELINLTPEFPIGFYYDWWLAFTAACSGRINFIEEKLVQHRIHNESSTQKDNTDARLTRVYHLNLFLNHPLTPDSLAVLLKELLAGYQELQYQPFSLKLLILLLSNSDELLFIRKKSFFSMARFLIKECSN